MQLLLAVLVPGLLILVLALVMLWMPLPAPFPPAFSHGRNLPAAVITGLLGAAYVVALVFYVVGLFLEAGHVLDPVLGQTGLAAESYLVFGRRYHGLLRGRRVEVTYVPARAAWPNALDVYVGANVGTRLALGRQRPLLDCRDCARLPVDEATWGGLQVYAQDEGRARRLLTDSSAAEVLQRLVGGPRQVGFGEVYLQPERVWMRCHVHGVTAEQFQGWLDDLLLLADRAEKTR